MFPRGNTMFGGERPGRLMAHSSGPDEDYLVGTIWLARSIAAQGRGAAPAERTDRPALHAPPNIMFARANIFFTPPNLMFPRGNIKGGPR